jgi:hypothetical protein
MSLAYEVLAREAKTASKLEAQTVAS